MRKESQGSSRLNGFSGSLVDYIWLEAGVNENGYDKTSRFNFCNVFNVVTFVRNVLRKDRSSSAPGAEAALDQSAAAV